LANERLSIDLERNELLNSAGQPVALRRRSLGLLLHLIACLLIRMTG